MYAIIVLRFLLDIVRLGTLISMFYRTQGLPLLFTAALVEVRHLSVCFDQSIVGFVFCYGHVFDHCVLC